MSAASGRVSIEGSTQRLNGETMFSFRWQESGGPIVLPPTRKGFGGAILLDAAKQFGQHVALNFDPLGLSYEIQVPLTAIEGSRQQASGSALGASAPGA
jgi:two-component sensor histidine kinase